MDHTVYTLQTHHICLHLVSVHQTAPPLTCNSSHLITAYYSFIDPREEERLSWMYNISYATDAILPRNLRAIIIIIIIIIIRWRALQ